jgi:hypothetical protein
MQVSENPSRVVETGLNLDTEGSTFVQLTAKRIVLSRENASEAQFWHLVSNPRDRSSLD